MIRPSANVVCHWEDDDVVAQEVFQNVRFLAIQSFRQATYRIISTGVSDMCLCGICYPNYVISCYGIPSCSFYSPLVYHSKLVVIVKSEDRLYPKIMTDHSPQLGSSMYSRSEAAVLTTRSDQAISGSLLPYGFLSRVLKAKKAFWTSTSLSRLLLARGSRHAALSI